MSVREINIPFGPDKTGGIGFGILADDAQPAKDSEEPLATQGNERGRVEVADDPFVSRATRHELPSFASYDFDDETVAAPVSVDRPVFVAEEPETVEFDETPAIDRIPSIEAASETVILPPVETLAPESPMRQQPDVLDAFEKNEEAAPRRVAADSRQSKLREEFDEDEDYDEKQNVNDVQTSFAALRNSMGQSRELKVREKELEEFRAQLELETEELADREDILANYEALVGEQDRIIEECTNEREDYKHELAQVMDDREQIGDELEEMRTRNDEDLEPLQGELGRARAIADQAKNDERSRKSELAAAEAEVRRAGSGQDAVMAQARYDSVRLAHEKAAQASEHAQDMLDEAQRAYDDAMAQIEQMETPLKHALEDLAQSEDELKELIAQLGDDISVAKKRRQYCESVHLYPDETAKLRKAVTADEKELYEMKLDYEELREQLQANKSQALKAKVALGLGVVVVVAFIVILMTIFLR